MKTLASALFLVCASTVASTGLSAELGPAPPRETSDAPAKASTSFKQGVELYRESSFEAALAEFRKAYQLSPSYKVLYNIAQAYYELHDYVNAQTNLRQYLSEGGSEIPADRRAEVQELFEKLGERIAYLEVDTNVADAEIRVDDVSVGVSPMSVAVPVNIGRRRVSVAKLGFAPTVRVVTVASRERLQIRLDVAQQPASGADRASPTTLIARNEPEGLGTASDSSRTLLLTSVVATTAFALATGTFAWLALDAKKRFERELETLSTSNAKIDDARSRMKTYAYLTDGFAVATVLSGGAALYLALTGDSSKGKRKESANHRTVVLAPTVGGMTVHGSW